MHVGLPNIGKAEFFALKNQSNIVDKITRKILPKIYES